MENKKVIVITGAAQGIGRAIAERCRKGGFNLVLLDRNLDGFAEYIDANDPDVLIQECDITDKAQVETARDKAIERFGAVDALVNNAGIGLGYAKLEDVSLEDWNKVLNVNLNGTLLCCQIFGKCMFDRGGSITNISSQAGMVPSAFRGAYSPSKAAVIMLTQQIALEWGPRKVRANAVLPGIIKTAMSMKPGVFYDEQARADIIPSSRVGLPEDIANVVYFLSTDDSSYINGESILVDGGFTKTSTQQLARINKAAK